MEINDVDVNVEIKFLEEEIEKLERIIHIQNITINRLVERFILNGKVE